jgi:hypothetical protein
VNEGRWSVTRLQTVLPDSGARPQELVRKGRGRVARFVSLARVYPDHDCVIFLGKTDRPMWFVVCGDRQPVPLVSYGSDNEWYTDEHGLSRWLTLEIGSEGTRISTQTYAISDLSQGNATLSVRTGPVAGNTQNPATREPAWMFAIRTNNCAALRSLDSIPLNEAAPYDSPLIAAVLHRDLCMARVLIDRGADVNQVSSRGETALSEAVNSGNRDMAELLMSTRPSPDTIRLATERARSLNQVSMIQLLERSNKD